VGLLRVVAATRSILPQDHYNASEEPEYPRKSGEPINENEFVGESVHNIDVLPTFLAGAEPEVASKVDGRNLRPVWRGQEKVPPRTLFWEWRVEGHNQLAAMRGDLKLVITGNNRPELFNVVNDPGERRSVIAEHAGLAKELEKELRAWLATETEASKWGKTQPKP
jgi:arylsulfatase A-like enzyme